MGLMRGREALDAVLLFVRLDILEGRFDLAVVADAKSIMVVVRLVARVRSPLVDDQKPIRVRMLENGFSIRAPRYFERQQVGKNRQCLVQRATFVVAMDDPHRFQHNERPFPRRRICLKIDI